MYKLAVDIYGFILKNLSTFKTLREKRQAAI